MSKKPQIILSYIDAADFDQRYGVVEEVLKEMGKIPDPEDVKSRLRVLGSAIVGIEYPCKQVAMSEATDSEAYILMQGVIEHIECIKDQVASLLVDLSDSQRLEQIVESAK